MWRPTLYYLAVSVLSTAPTPDWRFFFLLCIHCYAALYDAYPFAESAIQYLLDVAREYETISVGEAESILKATFYRKERARRKEGMRLRGEKRKGRHEGLVVSEREGKATEEVERRLKVLSLFDQFTEDVLYGAKVERMERADGGGD